MPITKTISIPVNELRADAAAVAAAADALDEVPSWLADYRDVTGTTRQAIADDTDITPARLTSIETKASPATAEEGARILDWILADAIAKGYDETASIGEPLPEPEVFTRQASSNFEEPDPDAPVAINTDDDGPVVA